MGRGEKTALFQKNGDYRLEFLGWFVFFASLSSILIRFLLLCYCEISFGKFEHNFGTDKLLLCTNYLLFQVVTKYS